MSTFSFAALGIDSNVEETPEVSVPFRPATFLQGEEFWCHRCDCHKVHSDKPETGKFFCVFGHGWDVVQHKTKADDWHQTIFALCTSCLKGK